MLRHKGTVGVSLRLSHRQTADLLGHEDVRFTLNVYAQSGLDPDEMLPPVRKAFDWALDWASMTTFDLMSQRDLEASAVEGAA